MKLNWKDSFKEENNDTLLKLFSQKDKINIDPQIYVANILFERNYDLDVLMKTKEELMQAIKRTIYMILKSLFKEFIPQKKYSTLEF